MHRRAYVISRYTQRRKAGDRGEKYIYTRKGRNCGQVPRGRAINVDCTELPLADKMTVAKNGERERDAGGPPLIAEILEVNWNDDRASRTLVRRNAFQLS